MAPTQQLPLPRGKRAASPEQEAALLGKRARGLGAAPLAEAEADKEYSDADTKEAEEAGKAPAPRSVDDEIRLLEIKLEFEKELATIRVQQQRELAHIEVQREKELAAIAVKREEDLARLRRGERGRDEEPWRAVADS